MLLLIRSDEDCEALTDAERDYEAIERWWAVHAQAGHVVGGHELQPARMATTVQWDNGKPEIVDGPFIEAKESIGGYGIVDVPDLDSAISIARTWPAPGHRIEIRPVVDRR
jgi:hypothetical protein